jgi:hypothetical protein
MAEVRLLDDVNRHDHDHHQEGERKEGVGVPDDGSLNDDRLVVREEDDDLPARYLLEKLSGLLWDGRLANMAKAMNQSLRSSAFSVRPSTFFDRGQDLLSNKPGCQNCSQPDPNQPN